ncbi:FAD-binding oxidoreductase [Arenibacter sp. GZD96]|uniref:FAD-binding oxidoreductase n=1 Tax=Aurantibrevibacter litoralis TaxID=3106030 RepID=UPI002AFEED56|nr:FAD-binding oxidoreductase [Arenibacter sp. GZD-96]MEA1785447.1 FAD-binding oxidoreductase [Arenibacter sp. GZD-96]
MNFEEFIVDHIAQESSTIISLYVKKKVGNKPVSYLPGQYVAVQVPIGGSLLIRNYTLSDAPDREHYRLTIKKEPNGLVSNYVHNEIKIGSTLKVSSPMGNFYLATENEDPVLFLSAGVGITPMISMLEYLALHQPSRKVFFIHSSRSQNEQPMAQRLKELANKMVGVEMQIHHTQPADGEISGVDYDVCGRVEYRHLKKRLAGLTKLVCYICGPIDFMKVMTGDLMQLGLSKQQVKQEFFVLNQNEQPHPKEEIVRPSTLHQVHFVKSERKIVWDHSKQNILELAESVGVQATSSCRIGTCATCETNLLKGKVSYNPEPFMEPQFGKIFICCAKPDTNIEILL